MSSVVKDSVCGGVKEHNPGGQPWRTPEEMENASEIVPFTLNTLWVDEYRVLMISTSFGGMPIVLRIGTALINNVMYADDLVILAPSHVGLSMLLPVCSDYGLEHDIKFNSAKSNMMIFCCKKFKDIQVPSFELNDNILPRVNQFKYLGHVITDDLKDDNDITRQYKRIYAQGNALIRKCYMCSDHVKCTPFRSFCTSLCTCQLWCNYKSESIRKLYVAYNNVFRLLCNEPRYCSASYMFVTLGLPTCKMLIRKKVYSFMMCV